MDAEAAAILRAWRQFRSRRASAARVFPGFDWYEVQIGAYWLLHWIGDLSYSIRNVRGAGSAARGEDAE